jgi:hypothetical protein
MIDVANQEIKVCPSIDLMKIRFGTHAATSLKTSEIVMYPSIDLMKIMIGGQMMIDVANREIRTHPSIDLIDIMFGMGSTIDQVSVEMGMYPSIDLMQIMIGLRLRIKMPGGRSTQVDVTVTSREQGERVENIETPVMKTKTRTTMSQFTGRRAIRVDATGAGIRKQRYQRQDNYKTVTQGE